MFERFFFYCSTSIIILMDSTVPRSVDNGQSSSKSFFSLVKWDIEGIDGIRCAEMFVCLFFFLRFAYYYLLFDIITYTYIYIYSKLKFMETFFFFLLYHKRTRLRSVGREISLRSRREETEKDRDGRKGFGTASCGSLFFPFFF